MITTTMLLTYLSPYIVTIFVTVVVVKTLKIYSFTTFQVYSTVLLSRVTILDIRSPEFIHSA